MRNKAFNIPKNSKHDGYQEVLLLWFISLLIKSPKLVVLNLLSAIKNENKQNEQLAEEMHKSITYTNHSQSSYISRRYVINK